MNTTSIRPGILDLLVQAKVLPDPQIARSIAVKANNDEDAIEQLLLQEGHLSATQLGQAKAQANGWTFVDLETEPVTNDITSLLPSAVMQAQRSVPIRRRDGTLVIAMRDPGNGMFVRLLSKKFGPELQTALATDGAIGRALARADMSFRQRTDTLLQRVAQEQQAGVAESVVQLVESLVLHATQQTASDVHIEPRAHEVAVRERVDGVLRQVATYPLITHEHVVLRLKYLAQLATDEHLTPQDGKFQFTDPDGRKVDIRISFVPTTHGEKAVLRLLVPEEQGLPLDALGLSAPDQEVLHAQSARSWGMVLVTGPTGSGKTTSLYAVLRRLNTEGVNISTIEDPVEYELPGANQIQVNEKAGITFATGLRSIVRQDPNIILVGEIRDRETAGIAINAAMTGHLVFSTLHTNNAATAIPRLVDMGVEPFLLSSTVNAIVAQRLVRKICMRCRESTDVHVADLADSLPPKLLARLQRGRKTQTLHLYHGKGCALCQGTGFHGRLGIFEILTVNDVVRGHIMHNADASTIHAAAVEAGMRTMEEDGIDKVLEGITTIEEILRVTRA